MATNQLGRVLQTLRGDALPYGDERQSDGQLLETYIRTREEAAFAALVRRHGPLVRVLLLVQHVTAHRADERAVTPYQGVKSALVAATDVTLQELRVGQFLAGRSARGPHQRTQHRIPLPG